MALVLPEHVSIPYLISLYEGSGLKTSIDEYDNFNVRNNGVLYTVDLSDLDNGFIDLLVVYTINPEASDADNSPISI